MFGLGKTKLDGQAELAKASAAKANAKPEANTNAKASATKEAEDLKAKLHVAPEELGQKYEFKSVTANGEGLSTGLSKILNRFSITAENTNNKAVLSSDGNTLVVVTDGQTSLSQLFGGNSGISRFFNKILGWIPKLFGGADKAIAAKKYQEIFNGAETQDQGEPLKNVINCLQSDEYHTVTVFHKNTETGDFTKNPAAVAITDAYSHLIEPNMTRIFKERMKMSDEEIAVKVKEHKERYKNYYTIDKLIPFDDPKELGDISHQVIEGLFQSKGFDCLVVPTAVHSKENINSNDLNYMEADWHKIFQKPDGNWAVMGDEKGVEAVMPEDREKYKARVENTPVKFTFVRPKEKAKEPLSPFIAYMQGWSNMSQGSELRTDKKEDLELIEHSEQVNAKALDELNSKQKIAEDLVKDLKAPWKTTEASKALAA